MTKYTTTLPFPASQLAKRYSKAAIKWLSQPAHNCSNLTMEKPEQSMKYVWSWQYRHRSDVRPYVFWLPLKGFHASFWCWPWISKCWLSLPNVLKVNNKRHNPLSGVVLTFNIFTSFTSHFYCQQTCQLGLKVYISWEIFANILEGAGTEW